MDQTFNFRAAPVPLHRRLSPRAIALVVAACLVLSGLVSFSTWVIDSERRSMARAEGADGPGAIVGTMSGSDGRGSTGSDAIADDPAIDAAARANARSAFELARTTASGRATFLDAGPGQLGALSSSLVFVDGPEAQAIANAVERGDQGIRDADLQRRALHPFRDAALTYTNPNGEIALGEGMRRARAQHGIGRRRSPDLGQGILIGVEVPAPLRGTAIDVTHVKRDDGGFQRTVLNRKPGGGQA